MVGLLAGLDALLLGAVALALILFGPLFLRPLLVGVLARAPFIGGWLAGNIDSGLAGYQSWLQTHAGPWVAPLADALGWLGWVARALPSAVLDLGHATYAAVWNLRHLDLPALEARAAGFAAAATAELRRLLLGSIASAEAEARGLVAAAEAEARALVGQAEAAAVHLALEAEAEASVLVEAARHDAAGLVEAARAEAVAGIAEAEHLAAGLAAAERQAMLAAVNLVEHDLQALATAERVVLEDSIAVVGGEVAASAAQAKQDLTAAQAEIERSIDGILNSLPWQSLAAGVAASEEVLKADVRTLVVAGAAEIRKAMGDAESIRARYGPQVRAALADLAGKV